MDFASSKPIVMIPNLDLVHKMPNLRMQLEIQKIDDIFSLEGATDWLMWFDEVTISGVWFALATKFITHPVLIKMAKIFNFASLLHKLNLASFGLNDLHWSY